ncbi:MAG: phospholipase D-like domain-containing protein, partial [Bdellovibrio sp.]
MKLIFCLHKFTLTFFLLMGALSAGAQQSTTPAMTFSEAPHTVQLLDVGGPVLERFLDIIEKAEHSVDISNYLINYNDYSSLLVFDAIQKKAANNKNCKARILLEDSTSAGVGYRDTEFWAWRKFVRDMKARGIEFRVFNPRSKNPINGNVRTHQKFIIADGHEMVLGGRNLSDDYYGIVPFYNRLDKEIYVKGPIVKVTQDRFLELWNGPMVKNLLQYSDAEEIERDRKIQREDAGHLRISGRSNGSLILRNMSRAIEEGGDGLSLRKFSWIRGGGVNITILYSDRVIEILKTTGYDLMNDEGEPVRLTYSDFIHALNAPKEKNITLMHIREFRARLKAELKRHSHADLYPEVIVNKIGIGFDLPGTLRKEVNFIPYFYETLKEAKSEVVFENQYFIPSPAGWQTLDVLQNNGVAIKFLTNSMVSQDENNPGTLTHDRMRDYLKSNSKLFHPFAFIGQKLQGIPGALWWPATAANPDCVWQIHGKAVVIDQVSSWVGSNNFDNRSEEFNPETAVYIPHNAIFAKQLYRSIHNNILNSEDMSVKSGYWQRYDQKREQRSFTEKILD